MIISELLTLVDTACSEHGLIPDDDHGTRDGADFETSRRSHHTCLRNTTITHYPCRWTRETNMFGSNFGSARWFIPNIAVPRHKPKQRSAWSKLTTLDGTCPADVHDRRHAPEAMEEPRARRCSARCMARHEARDSPSPEMSVAVEYRAARSSATPRTVMTLGLCTLAYYRRRPASSFRAASLPRRRRRWCGLGVHLRSAQHMAGGAGVRHHSGFGAAIKYAAGWLCAQGVTCAPTPRKNLPVVAEPPRPSRG